MATTTDPARAQLVQQEYRYKIVQDPSVKSKYPSAREIILDTNLDETGAGQLGTAIFNRTSGIVREFTFTIEGVMFPEDFTVSPPRWTLSFARHPSAGNVIYTTADAEIDFATNTTKLTVVS